VIFLVPIPAGLNANQWHLRGLYGIHHGPWLGNRIALVLVRGLGRRTLGLSYAVTFAELILAPATPSNTARSGGTI
jgi:hypothetical protein